MSGGAKSELPVVKHNVWNPDSRSWYSDIENPIICRFIPGQVRVIPMLKIRKNSVHMIIFNTLLIWQCFIKMPRCVVQ